MSKIRDITGQRFGKLVVTDGVPKKVAVRCDCGVVKEVLKTNIVQGRTLSCASIECKGGKTHGATGTKTYVVYRAMLQRCYNPNNPNYHKYGARGINVCRQWRKGYEFFVADMGESPEGLQLERINNGKGYSPKNCRWANPKEQARNTRRNVRLTMNGQTKVLADWAAENGLNRSTVYKRVNRSGWSLKRAVTEAAHA